MILKKIEVKKRKGTEDGDLKEKKRNSNISNSLEQRRLIKKNQHAFQETDNYKHQF